MNDRFFRTRAVCWLSIKRYFWRALLVWMLVAATRSAEAYSVLTHEQLIDLAWTSTIAPLLTSRFPRLTPEQLKRAHAYAYGGCVIQDLGYYPFGNGFFSDLTHYVRSGDFVSALFRHAKTADELAFAIGALTHYIGDTVGHSQATNPSVAKEFPKLRAKYGRSVNYAQDPHAHGRVEFAFDINQLAKGRLPPSAYLRSIGLEVPRVQLAAAFYETYGFNLVEIISLHRTAFRGYRFGVRRFFPGIAKAEVLIHRKKFPEVVPSPELSIYENSLMQLNRDVEWRPYRRGPSVFTYLLAGLIVIAPKIGPVSMLAIKGPTADTEMVYIKSVNRSAAALSSMLAKLAAPTQSPTGQSRSHPRFLSPADLPDRDLDTGERVVPGGYPLTDKTYAKLLARVTKDPAKPVPPGLKADILQYYADPNAPISTKKDQKKWDEIQKQLPILATMPTSSVTRAVVDDADR